jgi:hypothetical protein
VFDSETYGRVLVLDGCIQLTQRDEFSYQVCRGLHPTGSLRALTARCRPATGNDGAPAAVLAEGPAAASAGGARASRWHALGTLSLRCARFAAQVGGGDGGVVREITRHSCVERIDCAEIDGMVPEARSLSVVLPEPAR